MVANMMGFITISLNPIFAGRLGDPSLLAGVGVGSVLVLVFLITVYMGLNAAQDTLTSQAFGNGNIQLCGEYLNRGLVIVLVSFLPIALIPCWYGQAIL